jgi:hypothetical protein
LRNRVFFFFSLSPLSSSTDSTHFHWGEFRTRQCRRADIRREMEGMKQNTVEMEFILRGKKNSKSKENLCFYNLFTYQFGVWFGHAFLLRFLGGLLGRLPTSSMAFIYGAFSLLSLPSHGTWACNREANREWNWIGIGLGNFDMGIGISGWDLGYHV